MTSIDGDNVDVQIGVCCGRYWRAFGTPVVELHNSMTTLANRMFSRSIRAAVGFVRNDDGHDGVDIDTPLSTEAR